MGRSSWYNKHPPYCTCARCQRDGGYRQVNRLTTRTLILTVAVGVVSFLAGVWVGLGNSPGWIVAPVAGVKDSVDEAIARLQMTEVERLEADIENTDRELREVIAELRAIGAEVGGLAGLECIVPGGFDTSTVNCRLRIRKAELESELEDLWDKLALAKRRERQEAR